MLNASGSEATRPILSFNQRSEGLARILRRQKHSGGLGMRASLRMLLVASSPLPLSSEAKERGNKNGDGINH